MCPLCFSLGRVFRPGDFLLCKAPLAVSPLRYWASPVPELSLTAIGRAFPLPGGFFPGLPGGHFFSRNPPGKLPESPLLFPLVRWEKGEILQVFQKNFH